MVETESSLLLLEVSDCNIREAWAKMRLRKPLPPRFFGPSTNGRGKSGRRQTSGLCWIMMDDSVASSHPPFHHPQSCANIAHDRTRVRLVVPACLR